jgi:hypothetical protein
MWNHVVWYTNTNILAEHTAFLFYSEDEHGRFILNVGINVPYHMGSRHKVVIVIKPCQMLLYLEILVFVIADSE